jgi:hypothetical protein
VTQSPKRIPEWLTTDLLVIVVSLAIIGIFIAIHDPPTREAHTPVAHDQPAGDRRIASDYYRHLYSH